MNGISVQVRTRSKILDYRFVGRGQPPERWWEKNYGRWTDFSRPTILVEPGKIFVSGIASARTDSKGARIHYALHVMVQPDGQALAAQLLAWLCNIRQRSGSFEDAGKYLDTLGEDAWSAAVQGENDEIDEAVMAVLLDIPLQPDNGLAPSPFVADIDSTRAFTRLAAMAAMVVALKPGGLERAVYLNLASSSELAALVQHDGCAIVCRKVDTLPKPARPFLAGAAVVLVGLVLVVVFLFSSTSQ
ncbi:hypothetical protein [Duganella sp. FT27W]|uniref:hypothetical protein n=1 Tax=Duganella sp. FT27W TaxID=2654636 RepID=UPI00128DEC1D|nr:hypothetical protein [Duganella sp. FT27W]MPQ55146.1 hypothetical protein [Duganella sp. FT27W]